MRLYVTGLAAAVALGIGLPGCVAPTELPFFYSASPNGDFPYQFPRIDAQEAAGAKIAPGTGAGTGIANATPPPRKPVAELSPGFVSWMIRHRISLACTASRAGSLLLVGSRADGSPGFARAAFPGARGRA